MGRREENKLVLGIFKKIPTIFILAAAFFLFQSPLMAKARRPEPGQSLDVYSLSKAERVPIAAKKTKLPLIIFGEDKGASSSYAPSGFMGDSRSMKIKTADFSAPLLSSQTIGTTCLRIEVQPTGREGWVGLYWQTPANNWGKIKGAGFDLSKAQKLVFWARGEKGGERINVVKVGGLIGPYPDTDSVAIGPLRLNKEWTLYTIDLKGKDLRHIIGGFAFSLLRSDNPRGAVFYLDEIVYQGDLQSIETVADSKVDQMVISSASVKASPGEVKPIKTIKIVIPFSSAKTAFTAESQESLNEIAAVAMKSPSLRVLVEGHTDNVGPSDTNKKLSFQRAKAVADYLISRGVLLETITVDGLGEEQPIREGLNDSAQGRMENRRVEVSLVPK